MNDTSVFSCSALLGRLCSVAGCVVCQMFPFLLALCTFKDQFLLEQPLEAAIQYIITYGVCFNKSEARSPFAVYEELVSVPRGGISYSR